MVKVVFRKTMPLIVVGDMMFYCNKEEGIVMTPYNRANTDHLLPLKGLNEINLIAYYFLSKFNVCKKNSKLCSPVAWACEALKVAGCKVLYSQDCTTITYKDLKILLEEVNNG